MSDDNDQKPDWMRSTCSENWSLGLTIMVVALCITAYQIARLFVPSN